MSRTLACAALPLLCLCAPLVRAEEDEPVAFNKKLSEWLTMLRSDPEPRHRQAALLALEKIGPKRSRQVVPAVVTALRDDKDVEVRLGAAGLLGTFAAKLRADNPETFKFDEGRDSLATALKGDKSPRVRAAAATALGRLGGEARGAVGILAAALKDPVPATRAAAADTLRRLGPDAYEAMPDLQQVLQDRSVDRATRVQCALAIGRIGAPEALNALSALKDVLGDAKAHADLRKAVCETLGMLGKEAAGAAPALGAALTALTSEVEVRRAAVVALDAMGSEGRIALPSLKKALKDDDKYVRCHAMHTLGQYGKELGPHARDVITALLQGMDDSVLEVRVAAIETLGILGAEGLGPDTKAVIERLTDAMRDSQKAVSDAANAALKKIQGMGSVFLPSPRYSGERGRG
jgi:HEAT repeat protein